MQKKLYILKQGISISPIDTIITGGEITMVDPEYYELVELYHHDAKTYSTIIASYSDLLSENLSAEDAKDYLRRIKLANEQLRCLFEDLRVASAIGAKRFTICPAPVDLKKSIDNAGAIFSGWSYKKGVELLLNVPDGLPKVLADSKRLTQIFTNLLSNAFKFTKEGVISIEAEFAGGNEVKVRVKDTGCGIPEHSLSSVFDRYKRLEGENISGSGLGLFIVKDLADLMNIGITVESEVGKGSTFTLIFKTWKTSTTGR